MFKPNDTTLNVTSMKSYTTPNVFIEYNALMKMKVYVEECKEEISWLGTVEKDGNNYLVTDVMLFEQEVHATNTDLKEQDLANFASKLIKENENGVEIWNKMLFWGHSHVNMGVFASGTDQTTFKQLYESNVPFYIRVICNKKGEMKLDLADNEAGYIYENIKWQVFYPGQFDLIDECKKEIARNIREKTIVVKAPNYYGTPNYTSYTSGYKTYSNVDDYLDYVKKKEVTEKKDERQSDNGTLKVTIKNYSELEEYFSDYEIEALANYRDFEGVKDYLISFLDFEDWTDDEFKDLYDLIQDYYAGVMFGDENDIYGGEELEERLNKEC